MPQEFDRRSLKLTPEQWAAVEHLAQELNATAPTGKTSGQPSWRTLIKDIANGTITLSRKESNP